MNQLLDRLIPSDDSHTVIVENKTYSIEVIPQNLMTFRVPSKNANSPAKFIITFNDSGNAAGGSAHDDVGTGGSGRHLIVGGTNKDLRIYVSQEDKEPKEGRCDASYFSENVFFVHTQNK